MKHDLHQAARMQPSVTLETKCWEQDWEFLLKTGRIQRTIERSRFNFAKRTLCINNVADVGKVCQYAQKLVRSGVLTDLVVVAEKEKSALEFYELRKESLTFNLTITLTLRRAICRCSESWKRWRSSTRRTRPCSWRRLPC